MPGSWREEAEEAERLLEQLEMTLGHRDRGREPLSRSSSVSQTHHRSGTPNHREMPGSTRATPDPSLGASQQRVPSRGRARPPRRPDSSQEPRSAHPTPDPAAATMARTRTRAAALQHGTGGNAQPDARRGLGSTPTPDWATGVQSAATSLGPGSSDVSRRTSVTGGPSRASSVAGADGNGVARAPRPSQATVSLRQALLHQ
jgi:hypothetical protein